MEYLEGRLLRYVAEEACDMANAWHALGTWAYDISKKSLDQIQLARGELSLKIYISDKFHFYLQLFLFCWFCGV